MKCPDCFDKGILRAIRPGERDSICLKCVSRVHDDVVMPADANPAEVLALMGLPKDLVDRVRKTCAEEVTPAQREIAEHKAALSKSQTPEAEKGNAVSKPVGYDLQHLKTQLGAARLCVKISPSMDLGVVAMTGMPLPKTFSKFEIEGQKGTDLFTVRIDSTLGHRVTYENLTYGELKAGVVMAQYGAGTGKVIAHFDEVFTAKKVADRHSRDPFDMAAQSLVQRGFCREEVEDCLKKMVLDINQCVIEGDTRPCLLYDIAATAICGLFMRKAVRDLVTGVGIPARGGIVPHSPRWMNVTNIDVTVQNNVGHSATNAANLLKRAARLTDGIRAGKASFLKSMLENVQKDPPVA